MRFRFFPLILIIVNLISAAIILVMALTGGLRGEDENLTVLGYFWASFLFILSISLMLETRVGKLLSIIITLSLPFFLVYVLSLKPVVLFPALFDPIEIFYFLFFTGNVFWFLWLANLLFIIRKK